MKILKLLNKKNFSIILISFLSLTAYAEDQPVDIWKIENQSKEENSLSSETIIEDESELNNLSETDIYNMQSQKKKIQ